MRRLQIWGIGRGTLGIVLSMELIGMAAGSVLLGNVADRFGRRPIIIQQIKNNAQDRTLLITGRDDEALNEKIRQQREASKDKDRKR